MIAIESDKYFNEMLNNAFGDIHSYLVVYKKNIVEASFMGTVLSVDMYDELYEYNGFLTEA